ncbi:MULTISPECIES: MmcQ/YjbR family DNA-binding protein [Petrimonas]|jgi:predicted DNA-binding protein (MmcQ/YjbR family)|uniref:MmcQ/YjbR family DNA-binding protein n=1 Tax=Petrimonas mucosa TaxID=1642646 RepID=A0A1G4G5D5_9BACT|nr:MULTISPECIES: MmcQ/YjbR family DNA-binding protein [Petrimonas]MDD3560941.1 MmcQ/YjbR family DNA-binding protein [Petrimonas mucosa]SCM56540.1 putative protein YjbR [Petrimonas mucosa]SFU57144.1 Predicted DNA-binding protein, MmcQ/YjbR family [Porphyromonadaceae bacterium KHP3R9]HHT29932.1 MmcQ/YjbR family DNA-binding protein [Petrimonas mucosa]
MNIEELYNYCLSIPGAEATTPFDDVTLVMKVCDKMFALIPLDAERLCIALKCDPDKAAQLREEYNCVEPAFHMNKTYWNTIYLTGEMADEEVKRWVRHSVDEVIKKLPKKRQKEYYGSVEQ